MKVLVVEANFEYTKKYSEKIISAGAEMEHVNTAKDALIKLKGESYQGLIISKWLPDMPGDLFKQLLTGSSDLKSPPGLVVTSPKEDDLTIQDYLRTELKTPAEN